jgi:hypothetical protein
MKIGGRFLAEQRGAFVQAKAGSGVLKPCANPTCAELVERGRCPKCIAKFEQSRGTTTQRGYDGSYERRRVECFERDEWRCVDCGWQPDIVRLALEAGIGMPPRDRVLEELRRRYHARERHLHSDHQIPIGHAPNLRLELANLRTRCNACHAVKTGAEHARNSNFDKACA